MHFVVTRGKSGEKRYLDRINASSRLELTKYSMNHIINIVGKRLIDDYKDEWRVDFSRKYRIAVKHYIMENSALRSGTYTQLVFRVL